MREKYVFETYPMWFENGGLILAFDTKREKDIDIRTPLTKADIEAIINEHDLVVKKLADMACAWAESDHDAFTKYWYPEFNRN